MQGLNLINILAAAAAGWSSVAALLAVAGGVAFHRRRQNHYVRLAARLQRMAAAGSICPLVDPDFNARAVGSDPIVVHLNAVLARAGRSVADAELRARELEIRLRVATAERRHAESIIDGVSDAVLVTDPSDELVLANASAAHTFDFDLARAYHAPVAGVLRDPKVVEMIRGTRQDPAGAGRRVVRHEVRTPTGGTRTFQVTLSRLPDVPSHGQADARDGQSAGGGARAASAGAPAAPAGVVAVLHDVTHERQVEEMKNDFVSNVSHELRTPLASIKAYVELLIDGEADDERTKREFYEVIQNEANRLGRLIDNILNISRIESGLVKVDRRPQSLSAVVKEALEVIAPQAAQKRLTVVERLAPVYHLALADRDMLYQAVLNLLSNAVKYTPEGGSVVVETAADEAARTLLMRVRDTGVGIAPEDMPFVFKKFHRAGAPGRTAPGTGLGLSLVKHVVEAVHGGRTFVESEVGKGSCFGFEIESCR